MILISHCLDNPSDLAEQATWMIIPAARLKSSITSIGDTCEEYKFIESTAGVLANIQERPQGQIRLTSHALSPVVNKAHVPRTENRERPPPKGAMCKLQPHCYIT